MKIVGSRTTLVFLIISILTSGFAIRSAKTDVAGTVQIKADGSVEPPTAPIHRDGDTYTLTDNITSNTDGMIIERDNMTLDGAGYEIRESPPWEPPPINLGYPGKGIIFANARTNVTVKNLKILDFAVGIIATSATNDSISSSMIRCYGGIILSSSTECNIVENNVAGTGWYSTGIRLDSSSNHNRLAGNNVTDTTGLEFVDSYFNNIVGNNVVTNYGRTGSVGIVLANSSNNTIAENNVDVPNDNYISQYHMTVIDSSNNSIYHNNFIDTKYDGTARVEETGGTNAWDDSYPSGGNYWNKYAVMDLFNGPYQNLFGPDGIGDNQRVIDSDNVDRYPFMRPVPEFPSFLFLPLLMASTLSTVAVCRKRESRRCARKKH